MAEQNDKGIEIKEFVGRSNDEFRAEAEALKSYFRFQEEHPDYELVRREPGAWAVNALFNKVVVHIKIALRKRSASSLTPGLSH